VGGRGGWRGGVVEGKGRGAEGGGGWRLGKEGHGARGWLGGEEILE